jgi:hypothetical protein
MTIVNRGAGDDRLIAALSPIAGTVEMHETKEVKGVVKMTPVNTPPSGVEWECSGPPTTFDLRMRRRVSL